MVDQEIRVLGDENIIANPKNSQKQYPLTFKAVSNVIVYGRKKADLNFTVPITEGTNFNLNLERTAIIFSDSFNLEEYSYIMVKNPFEEISDFFYVSSLEELDPTGKEFNEFNDEVVKWLRRLVNIISNRCMIFETTLFKDLNNFPNIKTGQTFIRTEDGWTGITIRDINSELDLIFNKYVEEINKKIQEHQTQMNELLEQWKQDIQKYAENVKQYEIVRVVTQTGHGFVFEPVMYSISQRKFVKAVFPHGADGVAVRIDDNNFKLVWAGRVEIPATAKDTQQRGFVLGEYYFLGEGSNGGIQREKPDTYYQHLFQVMYSDELRQNIADVLLSVPINQKGKRWDVGEAKTTVNDIEELKTFDFPVGKVVEVLGYYKAGDGANHKRIISNTEKGFNSITLNNGLYANLIKDSDIKNIILKKDNKYLNYMGKFDVINKINRGIYVKKNVDKYNFSYDESIFGTSFDTIYIDVFSHNTGLGDILEYPISLKQLKTNISNGLYKNKCLIIYILNDLITYDYLCGELNFSDKKVKIKSLAKNGTYITTYHKPNFLRYEQEEKIYVYDITSYENVISHIVEQTTLDDFGIPKILTKVNNESELVKGSYCIVGKEIKIYPHLRGEEARKNTYLVLKIGREVGFSLKFNNECNLIEDINFFIHQYATASCWIKGGTTIHPIIIFNNCKFLGGEQDSLSLTNQYISVCNECIGVYASKDCFNYHTTSKDSIAIEVNCIGYNAGGIYKTPTGNQTQHSNNATTAHDGMTIYRFGSIGFNCEGPVLADVNGCKSINYDCYMEDSITAKGYNANYHYQSDSNNYNEFVLINCKNGKISRKGELQNKGVHVIGDCKFICDFNENILQEIGINDISLNNIYKAGVINE